MRRISIAKPWLKPTAYAKGFAEKQLQKPVHLALAISAHSWCPCIFKDGVRLKDNFIASDVCALDFDSPETSLAWALNSFSDMCCVIGITKSHQKDKNGVVCDRFRVVIPWQRTIVCRHEYEDNMRRIINRTDADSACCDAARFFYPCLEIVKINFRGYCEEVVKSKTTSPALPRYAGCGKSLKVPNFIEQQLRKELPCGQRNATVFNLSLRLAICGFDLAQVQDMVFSNPTCSKASNDGDFTIREISDTIAKGYKTGINRLAGMDPAAVMQ